MSRWGFLSRPGLSPHNSTLGSDGEVPSVTDEDYSYITSEEVEAYGRDTENPRGDDYPRDSSNQSSRSAPAPASGLAPEDDVLFLKSGGVTEPEHFPAYSIGDGDLMVEDVKKRVQIMMGLSDRQRARVKLLYKGKQLRDPSAPVRDFGVKNNSTVLAVLGGFRHDSEDSSEGGALEGVLEGGDKTAKKSRRKRKGKKRGASPRDSDVGSNVGSATGSYVGSNTGLDVPREDDRRRSSSRNRTESPASGFSGASTAAVPNSLIDKLNSIASHFSNKLFPQCIQFTENPPEDGKKRQDEHRKISETVMAQVILKLDEIDIMGEEAARNRRKEIIRHVQDVLKAMDEKVKT